LIRLAAQARKYGLGLIFATQAPRSIDHNIIANCANQFYGQANSPSAIDTIEELITQKGGSARDVSKLGTGNFYVYSESINGETPKAPIKIRTPLCLSYHPNSPMDENEVLEKAVMSKKYA
jgi:DNA helicase HerA-like ATPase